MKIDSDEVHKRTVKAVLDHDDVVKVLGLAVKLQAGVPSDQAGAAVDVRLVAADDGSVSAEVDVVIDLMPAAVPAPAVSPIAPVVVPQAAVAAAAPFAGLVMPPMAAAAAAPTA